MYRLCSPMESGQYNSLQRQVVYGSHAQFLILRRLLQPGHIDLSLGLVSTSWTKWYSNHKNVKKSCRHYHCHKPLFVDTTAKPYDTNSGWTFRYFGCFYFCLFVITWSDDLFFICDYAHRIALVVGIYGQATTGRIAI
jgi:hypothetical protein